MPPFAIQVFCTCIFGILVVWLPLFRDPCGMATPFSGSLWYGYPIFGILVVWLPHFRDPCGMGTPLSGSLWYGYPTFGILVVWLPPFRDPCGMGTPLSGSLWYGYPTFGILVKNHQNGGAKVQYSKLPLVLVTRRREFAWISLTHYAAICDRFGRYKDF